MKTLQNNFTTSEQSKRLLELGVPADSADCLSFIVTDKGKDIFDAVECGTQIIRPLLPRDSYTNAAFPSDGSRFVEEPFPCWSVGRLMEIWEICSGDTWEHLTNNPLIEDLMFDYEINIDDLDFTKLEK